MAVNFDRIAPFYDLLARIIFGNTLRKSQLRTLAIIPENASVLILGGGSGWYLESLLQQKQVSKIVYVEASAVMLRLSRKKIASINHLADIEFRLGTEQSIRAGEQFDVVITHFVLDLFTEPQLKNIIDRLIHVLQPEGLWLCSDFELSLLQSGQWWKKRLIAVMYIFFRTVSKVETKVLPDIHGLLAGYPLRCQYEATFYKDLIAARVYRK
jgi:ubiquinone/menaquinone biosynthesis C-methylase UbiE